MDRVKQASRLLAIARKLLAEGCTLRVEGARQITFKAQGFNTPNWLKASGDSKLWLQAAWDLECLIHQMIAITIKGEPGVDPTGIGGYEEAELASHVQIKKQIEAFAKQQGIKLKTTNTKGSFIALEDRVHKLLQNKHIKTNFNEDVRMSSKLGRRTLRVEGAQR